MSTSKRGRNHHHLLRNRIARFVKPTVSISALNLSDRKPAGGETGGLGAINPLAFDRTYFLGVNIAFASGAQVT
jgi:hypothetical protein